VNTLTDGLPHVVIANRDPTEKDTHFENAYWVSKEYTPFRVFRGGNGKWVFVGKFHPSKEEDQ